MPMWVQSLITIVCAVIASSGFWAFVQSRTNRDDAESAMLRGLAHDRIVDLGNEYLSRGYILYSEYENLVDYLFKPYERLGGNGTAKHIIERVNALHMYHTHIEAKEARARAAVEQDL